MQGLRSRRRFKELKGRSRNPADLSPDATATVGGRNVLICPFWPIGPALSTLARALLHALAPGLTVESEEARSVLEKFAGVQRSTSHFRPPYGQRAWLLTPAIRIPNPSSTACFL